MSQVHLQLQQAGMRPEEATAWLRAQQPVPDDGASEGDAGAGADQPLEVWPENWPVLNLFLRLQTQWMRGPDGRRDGLRYEAAQAAMGMMKTQDTATLFDHLVEMEHAALEALNGV